MVFKTEIINTQNTLFSNYLHILMLSIFLRLFPSFVSVMVEIIYNFDVLWCILFQLCTK